MDFPTEFIALRDRMEQGLDAHFESRKNVPFEGRTAALYSAFGLSEERKLLGLMPMGTKTHAHEHRLLFAAPQLDEAALADWWEYGVALAGELIEPDSTHQFSIVSIILVAEATDKAVQKKLRKLMAEQQYADPLSGWSSVRLAVVDLTARKVYTNRMGEPLRNVLSPWL